jgi:uncharacterized protein (DUF433 family)
MTLLPKDTFLGKLEIIEVYDFYDKPVLFACRNAADNLFLAVLEDEDEISDRWLYVGLSSVRFHHIHSGIVSLFSAFKDAENGVVFEVRTFHNSQRNEVQIINTEALTDDRLPAAGETLHVQNTALPHANAPLITKSEDVLGGQPVFYGTHIPVQNLVDYLTRGETIESFLDDFPTVQREQAVRFLENAVEVLL